MIFVGWMVVAVATATAVAIAVTIESVTVRVLIFMLPTDATTGAEFFPASILCFIFFTGFFFVPFCFICYNAINIFLFFSANRACKVQNVNNSPSPYVYTFQLKLISEGVECAIHIMHDYLCRGLLARYNHVCTVSKNLIYHPDIAARIHNFAKPHVYVELFLDLYQPNIELD